MSKNNDQWSVISGQRSVWRKTAFCLLVTAFCLAAVGCRYDMQDQPRYKAYKQSDFFPDKRASRDLPAGSVARGQQRADKAFYTGKKDVESTAPVQTTTDAAGNTLVASWPNAIEEFPVPVTQELLDRGEERYKVFCIVCHGPVGNGDGMIVRRGFTKPPTYNDDRLINAPVGHFYDVITNGQGRMNSYASQVPVVDRWAIVAYIRALQISQRPNDAKPLPMTNSNTNTTPPATTASPRPAAPATQGGAR
jgi:mono/diheme cytochrome c family protein